MPAREVKAFAQNQRDEVREVDVPGALAAEPGMKQQTYVRRLTPLECERLQGFPDHWTDIPGNSDTQRYRQLGNAVAIPVVEWIMRRIAA
jgi:DNA (cytosine-5)-methyltransferase 1